MVCADLWFQSVPRSFSLENRSHAGRYIFGIYDFDESGVLSIDETILALRSTVSGLCKVCGLEPPLESEIEAIALMVGTFV